MEKLTRKEERRDAKGNNNGRSRSNHESTTMDANNPPTRGDAGHSRAQSRRRIRAEQLDQIDCLYRETYEALIRLSEATSQDIAGELHPEFNREMQRIVKEAE
jgi:hypothetical protein